MRSISPSELSDFTFCQKFWYNKRKLGMVLRKLTIRDLSAMMGQTVGWSIDQTIKNGNNERIYGVDYFKALIQKQLDLGREYDFGCLDYVPKIERLVETLIDNIWAHQDLWLGDCKVVASEPVMQEWGQARQDLVLQTPEGDGIVLDFKCKLKADSDKFAISRDIDLHGNQAQLYPMAWNSLDHPLKIKIMRFVYIQEGRKPIVEDQIINLRRQGRWYQSYEATKTQIHFLEHVADPIEDNLTENPYHMTPWGYPCEFREYCASGEQGFGGASEFIQVERKEKV